jgi:hypothetical protein
LTCKAQPGQLHKIKVYSPGQVAVGSFIGGPIAAIYVIKKNFDALGNKADAGKTILWGTVFVIFLLVLLPFLPDNFPNVALPVAYTLAAWRVAENHQVSRKALVDDGPYERHSNWNVLGISIGFLILFLVIFIPWMFALMSLDIIKI